MSSYPSLFVQVLAVAGAVSAQNYKLLRSLSGQNLINRFMFMTDVDPNSGYVNYLSSSTALSKGLLNVNTLNQVYMGADSSSVATGRGRNAVWAQSRDVFGSASLLIADFAHIPSSTCGVWPSYWTINNHAKPYYGEIDILEGTNRATQNTVTLHTDKKKTCKFTGGTQTGTFITKDCSLSSMDGCEVRGGSNSMGDGFNSAGGGVYAMALEADSIRVWFFPRNKITSDITSGIPNPSLWGTPMANFNKKNGGCDIGTLFTSQMTVFKIDFCGENAGGDTWTGDSGCADATGYKTCNAYVQNNPSVFKNTYFLINYLKTYSRVNGTALDDSDLVSAGSNDSNSGDDGSSGASGDSGDGATSSASVEIVQAQARRGRRTSSSSSSPSPTPTPSRNSWRQKNRNN